MEKQIAAPIQTIRCDLVKNTLGLSKAETETFFFENGEDYAVDSEGLYYVVADVSNIDDLVEYGGIVCYANEDQELFLSYAEEGHVKSHLHKLSTMMKSFLIGKGIFKKA